MTRDLHRHQDKSHLHFITCSCYGRKPLLGRADARNTFVRILAETREDLAFAIVGYVVMPEHFHLLISEPATGEYSTVMQVLKQNSAKRLLDNSKDKTPERHFWTKRFYDFNVWSQKKRLEKLDYMHMNPVKRGLVKHPKNWPWSSYRFYTFKDPTMLPIDWKWPET